MPLGAISWPQIEAALAADQPLTATIQMTNARGEPVTASLKPAQLTWNP
jgi:hypothetical protein